MDYAAQLNAIPYAQQGASQLPMSTAQALAGDYAKFLTGPGGEITGGDGYKLKLAAPGTLPPEQESILELMIGALNNAPRAT